jgi:predicted Fe-Mo cluster-binding NifX family protein
MKVAFASMDGTAIDQHFGSARWWQIYEITQNGGVFAETRKAPIECSGHCEGGFQHLAELLRDCDAVFVSKIGESAAVFMLGQGKRVFEAQGEVTDIIAELKNSKF